MTKNGRRLMPDPEYHPKDALLLLCLYDRVQELSPSGALGEHAKAMALAFFAAYEMASRGLQAPSFIFYRHLLGPRSNQVFYILRALTAAGLLAEETPSHVLRTTVKGQQLAQDFRQAVLDLQPNWSFRETLDAVAAKYGGLDIPQLVREAHALPEVARTTSRERIHLPQAATPRELRMAQDQQAFLEALLPS